MAVVTGKSKQITNRDATPLVLSNPGLTQGEVKKFVALCAIAAADSSTSKYIFGSVPSNARLSQLRLATDAASSTASGKLGLYDTTQNGGAIVGSGDQFATSISLSSAITPAEELYHSGASAETIANSEKLIWDVLGLASDPCKNYDIVFTMSGDATNAINAVLEVTFVQ